VLTVQRPAELAGSPHTQSLPQAAIVLAFGG
jgi:hypothetical protein